MQILDVSINEVPIDLIFKGTDVVVDVGEEGGKVLIQKFDTGPIRVHRVGNIDALTTAIVEPEQKGISVICTDSGADLYEKGKVEFSTVSGVGARVKIARSG